MKRDAGKVELKPGAVVLVDEGGTLDVITGRKLQAAVDAVGGKFVLMGDDEHQQQAIGVGGAQNAAVRSGAPMAEMTNINRQRAGHVVGTDAAGREVRSHKSISNLLYAKKGKAALEALRDEGMIEVVDKGYQAEIATLAQRYVDAKKIDWKTGRTVTDAQGKAVPLPLHGKVTRDYNRFQLGYAGTNFSAQGQSKEAAFVYAAGMADHQKLVPALTRHKDRMTIVGDEQAIDGLVKAIETDSLKKLSEDVLRDKTVLNAGTQQRLADQQAADQAQRDTVAAHAEATLATFNLPVRATVHDARRDVIAAMADEHAKRAGEPNALTAVANPGDAQAVNAAIRERLKQDGRVRGDEVALTVTRGAEVKTLSLAVAEGDVLAFNSPKAAAVTHGLTDPANVRLAVLNVKGGEQPEIRARVIGTTEQHPDHGRELTLTHGAGVEHAHAVPLFRAEKLAAGKTVQVMAAEDGRVDLDALRKVQAGADAVTVRGTGLAFSATATTIGKTLHDRTDTTERAQAALYSLTDRGARAPVQVVHDERKPEALKALGRAYVESAVHDRDKIATAGNVGGVRLVNQAVREALREANLLGEQDVVANPRTKSPLALADGERLVLRSEKGASAFNLAERLEAPAQATYRVRGIEAARDQGVSAVLQVESPNPTDDGRTFTVNDRALAYMTHAYATTHEKAAALNRAEVLAFVTDKDKPQAVTNVLTSPAHGTVYGSTRDVQGLTGRIDGAQRVAAEALDRAASMQGRVGQDRDHALRQVEQQKQQAVEQAQAAEQAQKALAEAQAQARRDADLKAVAEAVAEERQTLERQQQEQQRQQQRGRVREVERNGQQRGGRT